MNRTSFIISVQIMLMGCTDASLNQSFDVPKPGEDCNGEDDDGDGEIDEGYPDRDADGIADCLDDQCTPQRGYTAEVAIADTCWTPGSVTDPWDIEVAWTVPYYPKDRRYAHVFQTATGRVADTNRDGVVTAEDDAAVVVAFHDTLLSGVRLAGFNGRDGTLVWQTAPDLDLPVGTPLLLVDLHGDGVAEVVVVDTTFHLIGLDHTGAEVFRSQERLATRSPIDHPPVVKITSADFNGDGVPDLVAEDLVVDGDTGETLSFGFSPSRTDMIWRTTAVYDLDFDGDPEVFSGDQLFSSSGDLLWTGESLTTASKGHWSLAAEVDGDPDSELIAIHNGLWDTYDADGSLLARRTIDTNGAAPPCVADFDGDGVLEVANNIGRGLDLRELDGERQWRIEINDRSGFASCSAFDFDADGAAEVVFADQHTFYIVDGRTGTIRYQDEGHNSGTAYEHPTIGDIDGDGSVDIVVSADGRQYGNRTGITVYTHATGAWPPADFVWAQHDFTPHRVTRTGAVHPPDLDTTGGLLRARPLLDVDLEAEILDVCVASCEGDGIANARIEIRNLGRDVPPDPIPVSLWGIELSGTKVLIHQAEVAPVAPGETWGTDVPFPPFAFIDLELVVDEDNRFAECEEEDNRMIWGTPFCN